MLDVSKGSAAAVMSKRLGFGSHQPCWHVFCRALLEIGFDKPTRARPNQFKSFHSPPPLETSFPPSPLSRKETGSFSGGFAIDLWSHSPAQRLFGFLLLLPKIRSLHSHTKAAFPGQTVATCTSRPHMKHLAGVILPMGLRHLYFTAKRLKLRQGLSHTWCWTQRGVTTLLAAHAPSQAEIGYGCPQGGMKSAMSVVQKVLQTCCLEGLEWEQQERFSL